MIPVFEHSLNILHIFNNWAIVNFSDTILIFIYKYIYITLVKPDNK